MVPERSEQSPEVRLGLLGSILENANDAMLVTEASPIDEPGPLVVYVNAAFTAMTGYSPQEIVGKSPRILQGPETDRAKLDEIRVALEKGEAIKREVLNYRKDGGGFWVEIDIVPVGGEGSRPAHYVSVQRETTERVAAEEERFHAMVQHAPDVISLLDRDGKILYESPSVERVTGRRPGELVGDDGFKYVHPEDRERVAGMFAKFGREGGDLRTPVPYRFLHKDGWWVHLEATGSNRLDNPSVGAMVVNSRDVTERVEVERRLVESEERFRTAFEGASTGLALVSLDNRYLWVNRALCEMLRYTQEELAEKRSFEITHPEDLEKSRERTRRLLGESGPEVMSLEKRYLRKDGEVVWAISDVSLVYDFEGEPSHFVTQIQDITSRKRAEEELRESRAHLQAVVESMGEALLITDPDDIVVDLNHQFEDLTGYSRQEIVGRPAYELLLPPEHHQQMLQRNRQRMEGIGETYEAQLRRKDGSLIWIEADGAPYRNAEGEIVGTIGSISDITERKRAEEARTRLAAIVESSEAAIISSTPDGIITSWNAAAERLFGYSAGEALGQSGTILNPPERPEESLEAIRRVGAGGATEIVETVRLARDGSRLEVTITRSPIRDAKGNITGVSAIIRDISERKEAERALADSERRLKNVITGAPVIQFALDEEGVITLTEGKGLGALGLEPGEGVGYSVFEAYRQSPDVLDHVRRALAGEEVAAVVEIGKKSFDARYSPIREEDGRVTGLIGVATDITERRRLEYELAHRASHDPLTDLPNRAFFEGRLSYALSRIYWRQASVAVLFMDFDNFKVVNDSLGHEAGDRLLVAVAQRLRRCLRPSDTVARLGGDEFVVLLEEVGLEEAVGIAERVGEAFSFPLVSREIPYEVTLPVSIGIAMGSSSEHSPEDLIGKADMAMYRAKERGKSRYEIFDPQTGTHSFGRLELANELRRAIEGGELRVYYQPKVDLGSGSVTGFEALVRWEHPDRGLLPPEEFIPVAEETGLIVELGRWVLWEACRQAREWHERYPHSPPLQISVNLSAKQFSHRALTEEVEEVLRESGLDPASLELEITESAIMEDAPSTLSIMGRLKKLGVMVAVDDFGKGYSSLNYLKCFPVDVLKIDSSLVEGLGSDPKDAAIVSALVELAHALGQVVVGEGVEDARQLEKLRELVHRGVNNPSV